MESMSSAMNIEIEEIQNVSEALINAMNRLIPQLSSSYTPPSTQDLAQIVSSPNTSLMVAKDTNQNNRIVGCLTLVLYRIPTGVRAWIEDVVVDQDDRNKGIGEALNRFAMDYAGKRGAQTINLTSHPNRIDANRLYRHLGFKQLETNVYRFTP